MKIKLIFTSFMLSTLFLCNISYGATCDDLRELVGMERLDSGDFKEQIDLKNSIGAELRNLNIDSLAESQNMDSVFRLYDDLLEDKTKKEDDLSLLLTEDFFAPDIIEDAVEIARINSQLNNAFVAQGGSLDLQATYNKLVDSVSEKEKYANDSYDIGSLDAGWPINPSESYNLAQGFGERIYIYTDEEEPTEEVKQYAEFEDEPVFAQYREYTQSDSIVIDVKNGDNLINILNGVIISSNRDPSTDIVEVKVQSGKGIIVTYTGKFNNVPKLGSRVIQGNQLATLKDGSVKISVYLDETPINPAYLLGNMGKLANNNRIITLLESENEVNLLS